MNEELEAQLKCLVCRDIYTDPKVLQCNHVFCRDCLVGLARENPQGLPCPTCRHVTPIPPAGVAGLQTAFRTNQFLDIFYKHNKDILFNCQQHLTRKLELYCETCEEFICLECTIQQHNGHKYNLIGKVLAIPDGVTDVATVGENSTIPIQIRTHEGKLPEKLTQSLECELVSELTGTRTRGSAERRGDSQCEATYTPTIKGRHQLHIKLMGEHIIGSPHCVAVNKLANKKLGECITTFSGFTKIYGIAMTQRGPREIVVTSVSGNCVSVFSPSGDMLRSFGKEGTGQGQFDRPHGVAVDGEGNILVADCYNNRVQKFTAEGKFLHTVGARGHGDLEFICVKDIAINASNDMVYVVDEDNSRIQILNSDLTFKDSFGKKGMNEGELDLPCAIACDSTGNVYVADCNNNRIQVFTPTGEFLRMFGSGGKGDGQLDWPKGIAFDSEGKVYISDSCNHRISVFTPEGQFVSSFGSKGDKEGEFHFPRGMLIDSNGVLYVCDRENNRLQLF